MESIHLKEKKKKIMSVTDIKNSHYMLTLVSIYLIERSTKLIPGATWGGGGSNILLLWGWGWGLTKLKHFHFCNPPTNLAPI